MNCYLIIRNGGGEANRTRQDELIERAERMKSCIIGKSINKCSGRAMIMEVWRRKKGKKTRLEGELLRKVELLGKGWFPLPWGKIVWANLWEKWVGTLTVSRKDLKWRGSWKFSQLRSLHFGEFPAFIHQQVKLRSKYSISLNFFPWISTNFPSPFSFSSPSSIHTSHGPLGNPPSRVFPPQRRPTEEKLFLWATGESLPMDHSPRHRHRQQIRDEAIKTDHLSQYGFSRCLTRIKIVATLSASMPMHNRWDWPALIPPKPNLGRTQSNRFENCLSTFLIAHQAFYGTSEWSEL